MSAIEEILKIVQELDKRLTAVEKKLDVGIRKDPPKYLRACKDRREGN